MGNYLILLSRLFSFGGRGTLTKTTACIPVLLLCHPAFVVPFALVKLNVFHLRLVESRCGMCRLLVSERSQAHPRFRSDVALQQPVFLNKPPYLCEMQPVQLVLAHAFPPSVRCPILPFVIAHLHIQTNHHS